MFGVKCHKSLEFRAHYKKIKRAYICIMYMLVCYIYVRMSSTR